MKKKFNDTGTCVAEKHYMVDTTKKINETLALIEEGVYFTINRPRQFGKTTIISLITKQLRLNNNYFIIRLSFEGIGDMMFASEMSFVGEFIRIVTNAIARQDKEFAEFVSKTGTSVKNMDGLSMAIRKWTEEKDCKLVMIIDEVDKCSDNKVFLLFLGMLRNKYLLANDGEDKTFHAVVLAGVHDIKTLKFKITSDFSGKLNSPWNIASDYDVDLSFSPDEIATMLNDYANDKKIDISVSELSDRIYYYTSGYPYLVSKMCKIIDEKLITERNEKNWTIDDIDIAFRFLIKGTYTTTLFDDLAKNIENNNELYDFVYEIVINGKKYDNQISDPTINLAMVYGIISSRKEVCTIHNRIFEQRLYNHFLSKRARTSNQFDISENYISAGKLNMKKILSRFQQFMKEQHASKDNKFIEREGRMLFLSFMKPIINGKGHDFKEPVVGDERRTDIVITFGNQKEVVELKIWRGQEYHQQGLQQLSDYLDLYSLKKGWLVIFDFRKEKEYKQANIKFSDKKIFAVWV